MIDERTGTSCKCPHVGHNSSREAGGWGYSVFQMTGMIEVFWGFEIFDFGIFLVGKFWQDFLG